MCLDDIDGLEDAEITRLLVEGTDEEDEESYRMRLLESFDIKPFAGNKAYYEQEIGALDGVGGVKAKRRTGSTVDIVIIADDFSKPSEELIKKVQESVDPTEQSGEGIGIAPIGSQVVIKGVEQESISITTKVVCDTGYTVEGLRTQIEAAIEGYLLTLRKSWINTDSIIVRRAGLENAVYDIDGVIDVSSLTIDGANESGNKKLEENVIPVKGVIACS